MCYINIFQDPTCSCKKFPRKLFPVPFLTVQPFMMKFSLFSRKYLKVFHFQSVTLLLLSTPSNRKNLLLICLLSTLVPYPPVRGKSNDTNAPLNTLKKFLTLLSFLLLGMPFLRSALLSLFSCVLQAFLTL